MFSGIARMLLKLLGALRFNWLTIGQLLTILVLLVENMNFPEFINQQTDTIDNPLRNYMREQLKR